MTEANRNLLVLDSRHVVSIFVDCLFREHEDKTDYVKAEGVTNTFAFHAARLESHRDEIGGLLHELPDAFMESSPGEGWSFLGMCNDKEGNQWTDVQATMEQLLCLGLATRQAGYLLPRDMWSILPDHIPYVSIKDKD